MPNIFICGFSDEMSDELKGLIDNIMREIGLQDEAITSTIETRPESCDGMRTPMPYLWIRSTNKEEICLIIDAFKSAGIQQDLEWDVIGGFIPKDKMVTEPAKGIHANCPEYGSAFHMQCASGKCPNCGKP